MRLLRFPWRRRPARTVETADRARNEAAAWVLRQDRGLVAAEQDAFSEWLAADPRHGAALQKLRGHWTRLDHLADWRPEHGAGPNPDLLAPPLRRRVRQWAPVTLAAAAVAIVLTGWFLWRDTAEDSDPAVSQVAVALPDNQRVLPDGSIVELNRGAEVNVHFSPARRQVVLSTGEAHFTVEKDPARPFVVSARGVELVALGTAFNVRVDVGSMEVLVTEGRVQMLTSPDMGGEAKPGSGEPGPAVAADALEPPVLTARQRAVLSLDALDAPPQIAMLTPGEVERVLAWQHRMLDFTATPLHEVVAEFNRRNVVQLVLVDPELAATRVSATFRSDNIDGFVRLVEHGFKARAERRGDTEIVLRRVR